MSSDQMPAPGKIKLIKFPPPGQEKMSNAQVMPGGGGGDVETSIWLIHKLTLIHITLCFNIVLKCHAWFSNWIKLSSWVVLFCWAYSFKNLETKHILGMRVHIFPLGRYLGFGNCGDFWWGNICRGGRGGVEKWARGRGTAQIPHPLPLHQTYAGQAASIYMIVQSKMTASWVNYSQLSFNCTSSANSCFKWSIGNWCCKTFSFSWPSIWWPTRMPATVCQVTCSIKWNLNLTNLYLTKSSI